VSYHGGAGREGVGGVPPLPGNLLVQCAEVIIQLLARTETFHPTLEQRNCANWYDLLVIKYFLNGLMTF